MPSKPASPAVTVTVRPDGTYYVEETKVAPRQQMQIARVPATGPSPIAMAVTSSLREFAGIALAARAAVPALGKYGVLAAIGLGALNAYVASRPAPQPQFRRIQLRRIRR